MTLTDESKKQLAKRIRIDMASNGYLTWEETRNWSVDRLLQEESKFDTWLEESMNW